MRKYRVIYWGLMPDGRRVATHNRNRRIIMTHLGCVEFTDGTARYWQHKFYSCRAAAERGIRAMRSHRHTFLKAHGLDKHIDSLGASITPAYFLIHERKS
jgi:hypothetical protein